MTETEGAKFNFLDIHVSKLLLAANVIAAIAYFILMAFIFPRGNPYIFGLLMIGSVFHLWQTITYCHTIWSIKYESRFDERFQPRVDVFITVAGEPLDIVRATVEAAKNMHYPNFRIFILNDGFVTKKDNWRDIEDLAKELEVGCITRTIPGGAKAGNINNALVNVAKPSPFVTIFDADHIPHRDFLQKTVGYFIDPDMAFVQSPQFYRNYRENRVTGTSWEQQGLFFGVICKGKNRTNSVFMCGTNMVLRRKALMQVGGLNEENITEDILTSLFIHEKGWKSTYVPEVLAEGLAPEDLLSYCKQQHRWARGGLELLFKYNPLTKKGLSWDQKMQYISSPSYFLFGIIVFLNASLPIIFLFTGEAPFEITTMQMGAVFIPYIFLTAYVLIISSNFTFTYRAAAFSLSSFMIYIKALFSVLLSLITNKKATFEVTSKKKVSGNFTTLALPHFLYIVLAICGFWVAILRDGLTPGVVTNVSWTLFNIGMFIPFIATAIPENAIEFLKLKLLRLKTKQ